MEKGEFQRILQEENLVDEYRKVLITKLRCDVAEFFMTRQGYEDFFDLSVYIRTVKRVLKNGEDVVKSVVEILCKEINEVGFSTKLGYGDTALFIYKGDVPCNCW